MGALTVSISVPGEHDVGSRAQNLFERRVGAVTVGQGRHRPVAVNLRQGVGLALDPRCRDDLVAGADGQHHRDHVAVVDEHSSRMGGEGSASTTVGDGDRRGAGDARGRGTRVGHVGAAREGDGEGGRAGDDEW